MPLPLDRRSSLASPLPLSPCTAAI
ncbi:hypothetical protein A2U01_0110218, partial [Trifolium medium]|nr:hypothetical protein [Trifolium medium]